MTKPNPHSIFKENQDLYSWNKYIEQLEIIKLSKLQRERSQKAFQFMRSFFGADFLRKCFRKGHPMCGELLNSAPVARLRLTRFAESLQAVQGADGFEAVAKRLRKVKEPDEFTEASSVVETADKFQKVGFEIVFEPSFEITTTLGIKRTKNPDLKIINPKTAEEIIVEISRLRQSDEQVLSSISFNTIYFLIRRIMDDSHVIEHNKERNEQINHHILPYANILQHLGKKDLVEITEKINNLAKKVTETNKFQELIVKDKIEVAIAPADDHSQSQEWAKKRGMEDLVESPVIPLHEMLRTRMKIGSKIRQLPRHKPGIIVITTNETLLFYTNGIQTIINDIKSELQQYPQLASVVISLQAGQTPLKKPMIVQIGEDLYIKKTKDDSITEQNLIVTNPSFNLRISKSIAKLLTKAFIKY